MATPGTRHPLEPLTAEEIEAAWRLLALPPSARCCLLVLRLKPSGLFDRDPSLDVPEHTARHCH